MICTKCASKRGEIDHKGRPLLRNFFKDAFKESGARKRVRIVECSCLDLCPKHGQTVAVASELSEGKLHVVTSERDARRLAGAISARIAALRN